MGATGAIGGNIGALIAGVIIGVKILAMGGAMTGFGIGGAILGVITGAGIVVAIGVPASAIVIIDAKFTTRRNSAHLNNIAFFIKLPRLDNLTIGCYVLTRN